MISQTLEYALRAVVTIAQHDGHSCTAKQISELTQVPAPYLSKLMQRLVRAGVVHSQRGLHGGFVLAKQPDELTIWNVVDAVEPFKRIRECPLGIKSHGSTLCPLHQRLDKAMEMVEEMFRGTTVSDMLAEPGAVTPLCQEKKMFTIQANIDALKRSTEENSKSTKKKKK